MVLLIYWIFFSVLIHNFFTVNNRIGKIKTTKLFPFVVLKMKWNFVRVTYILLSMFQCFQCWENWINIFWKYLSIVYAVVFNEGHPVRYFHICLTVLEQIAQWPQELFSDFNWIEPTFFNAQTPRIKFVIFRVHFSMNTWPFRRPTSG
jgi:hypothetical protein